MLQFPCNGCKSFLGRRGVLRRPICHVELWEPIFTPPDFQHFIGRSAAEKPDHRHRRLLRARSERHDRCGAKHGMNCRLPMSNAIDRPE
jgi:hypothetical protein